MRRVAPSWESATRASGSGASVNTPSVAPEPASDCRAALVAASRRRYGGRVILGEALEEDAPVPGTRVVEHRGRGRAVVRQHAGVDVEHSVGRLEPGRPERPCVADRVELDGECATIRHAMGRARTHCQRTTPAATPIASIAMSRGDPSRPGTNDWCTSSLIA